MMRNLFFTILIFLTAVSYAQDETEGNEELSIWGKYTGENLYVLNPSENGIFSIQEVYVDEKPIDFVRESNAFEIPLEEHELDSFVYIKIIHLPNTLPLVVNEECLVKESQFSLPSFIYNKRSKLLEWKATEMDATCSYRMEQMLYGKWVTVKKLGNPTDMISENFLPVQISGMNMFRIVQTDENGQELSSPVVKLKSPNRKVMLMSDRVKDYIEFTDVTHYELYDSNGMFLKRGTAKKVNVENLAKGTYWVNFDGKEAVITKK